MKRAIVLFLMLPGCQFIPGTAAHDIRQAEAAVRYNLDDPASGNFRNGRVVGSGPARIVCGEVNAKNRMGAYVGFRPYSFIPTAKAVLVLPVSDGTSATNMAIINFPKQCDPNP